MLQFKKKHKNLTQELISLDGRVLESGGARTKGGGTAGGGTCAKFRGWRGSYQDCCDIRLREAKRMEHRAQTLAAEQAQLDSTRHQAKAAGDDAGGQIYHIDKQLTEIWEQVENINAQIQSKEKELKLVLETDPSLEDALPASKKRKL